MDVFLVFTENTTDFDSEKAAARPTSSRTQPEYSDLFEGDLTDLTDSEDEDYKATTNTHKPSDETVRLSWNTHGHCDVDGTLLPGLVIVFSKH